jgi:hypothetical protein
VFDLSDLSAPRLIGRYATRSPASHLVFSGDRLYVAAEDLSIYEPLSDGNLKPTGTYYVGFGNASRITIASSRAYVTEGSKRLFILQISGPDSLIPLGSISSRDGIEAVAVAGETMFAAEHQTGVVVLQVGPFLDAISNEGKTALRIVGPSGKEFVLEQSSSIVDPVWIPISTNRLSETTDLKSRSRRQNRKGSIRLGSDNR